MQPRRRVILHDWDWDEENQHQEEIDILPARSSWNDSMDLLTIVSIFFMLVCLVIRLSLLE